MVRSESNDKHFYHYIDPLVVEPSTTRTISSKSTAELQKEIDVLQGKLEVPIVTITIDT